MIMNEKNANGIKGFLLYSPINEQYFFRVYNDNSFTDYNINAEEIEIEILGDWISLYECDGNNKLDFSSKALGR